MLKVKTCLTPQTTCENHIVVDGSKIFKVKVRWNPIAKHDVMNSSFTLHQPVVSSNILKIVIPLFVES